MKKKIEELEKRIIALELMQCSHSHVAPYNPPVMPYTYPNPPYTITVSSGVQGTFSVK